MDAEAARRAETRQKIQLGGLIVKAGLAGVDAAVLLGILIEARSRVDDPAQRALFKRLGDLEFGKGQG